MSTLLASGSRPPNSRQIKEESVKRTRVLALIAGAATVVAAAALAPQAWAANGPSSGSQTEQYIVQFKPGADRGAVLRALGARFGVNVSEERQPRLRSLRLR